MKELDLVPNSDRWGVTPASLLYPKPYMFLFMIMSSSLQTCLTTVLWVL